MFRRTVAALALSLVAFPGHLSAQASGSDLPSVAEQAVPDDVAAIHRALHLPEVVDIMVEEGVGHGAVLAESIFGPSPVPAEWREMVAAIHDPDHIEAELLSSLARSLEGEDTAAILAFLEGEAGRRLMQLDLDARRALVDDDEEQQAREAAAVAMAQRSPRLDLFRRYVEANDLVETNVATRMNSSYAYLTGLMDGGALPPEMTEADVLSDVWAQEPLIRSEAVEWLYAYLLRAYGPATDAEFEALIDFSQSGPGQALYRAVREASEERYIDIGRALGLAAARFLTTEAL